MACSQTAARDEAVSGPAQQPLRVVVVDLNNFSTFPTLAIGILLASLRNAGIKADLLSPLADDVPAVERERPDSYFDHLARRLHFATGPMKMARDIAHSAYYWRQNRPHPKVLSMVSRALADKPDAILLSAYLQHFNTVQALAALAAAAKTPVLLGGPVFNLPSVAEAWRGIPGLSAIVGAEADLVLPDIVRALCRGGDLTAFEGVALPDGRRTVQARPLRPLNPMLVPDFTDFPWERYRVRIVPLMAGRGCQWDRCTFCSDITSVSGRTFRNRTVEGVMHEMREQSRRHQTRNFMFLDLKLNSNPHLLRGIVENVQSNVPGAQWIGTVHVDQRPDNGLSPTDLKAAVSAGMRRVSFGLESGSQRMLDLFDKGCTVEGNSEFIRTAYDAGLSVRCTMFSGYPGETARDLELTSEFLGRHNRYIDRVRFNAFSLHEGTLIHDQISRSPAAFPDVRLGEPSARYGRRAFVNKAERSPAYRRARERVLDAVYAINSRAIRASAREFDGLM
ncbi:B12-binding domain-containing radical SAM protein [Phenylobacterium deserti]|uniref:B12-binding domain-containing radical SAM protein n=1 Tax=Phenylobacterium deserti TaxID=1914756 RepID=A0A328AB63_9CAUL|nr:radical SAM protein [Phenylobacterium deserti]RAK51456.1 B12-binding domain-containing radical SAM protein [Phenylobacterium deserti]